MDLGNLTCDCDQSKDYQDYVCQHIVTCLLMIKCYDQGLIGPHLQLNVKDQLQELQEFMNMNPNYRFKEEATEKNRQIFINEYQSESMQQISKNQTSEKEKEKEGDQQQPGTNKQSDDSTEDIFKHVKKTKQPKQSVVDKLKRKENTKKQTPTVHVVSQPNSSKNKSLAKKNDKKRLPDPPNNNHPDQQDHKTAKQYIDDRASEINWYVTTAPNGRVQCPNHKYNTKESKIEKDSITFAADYLKIVPKNERKKIENTRRFFHANNDCLRMENYTSRNFTNVSPPFEKQFGICGLNEEQENMVRKEFNQLKYSSVVDDCDVDDDFYEDFTESQFTEMLENSKAEEEIDKDFTLSQFEETRASIEDQEDGREHASHTPQIDETTTSLYSPSTEPSSEEISKSK